MRSGLMLVRTVATVFLLGTAVTLHFMTPPVFEERFRTAIGTVRLMHQLGAEWSVETARVQADPSANFDGLAAFVPRMRRLKDDLSESIGDIPDLSERLTGDVRAYSATMDSLRERVERFKTAYAVIRNSERYFPLAIADLVLRSEQAGNQQLAREIADLAVEMDSYLASPSETTRELVSGRLQKVTEAGVREPEDVASSVENFAAHANVLLDKRVRSKELFEGIAASDLSERTNPLTEFLESVRSDRRRTTSLYQQSAVGCGVGALLMWVFGGFTRRSAATQQAASTPIVRPEGYAAKQNIASSREHMRVDLSTTGTRRVLQSIGAPTGELPVGVADGSGSVTDRRLVGNGHDGVSAHNGSPCGTHGAEYGSLHPPDERRSERPEW